jgi:enterochelin esterase-like enzyme
MRWLVLMCIVACGSCGPSSSLVAPGSPPSSQSPPAPPPPIARPAADPIESGKDVKREIDAGQIHRYRVTAAGNSVIVGVVDQDGIDLEVITYDATGAKLRTVDSPNGEHGPEPFAIEATVAGTYDFEVRQVELPPDEPADPTMSPHGKYRAAVDVMTADDYAYKLAKDRIASPRILAVWRDVRLHHAAAVDKFWTDLAGKGPIVEPYPDHPDESLVTFVMRTKGPYVGVIGVGDFREKPLLRIGDSDLWYASARMPADSRFDYGFIVADAPPELTSPYRPNGPGDGRLMKLQRDPTNPMSHNIMSRLELPQAQPQPWIVANPATPKGAIKEITIDSAALKEKRKVGVYLPPGYDPKQRYTVLIVFDGEVYGLLPQPQVPTPTILDNMIAAHKIPPIVAALVANQGVRSRDLAFHEPFGKFVADELVPKLRADFHAGLKPDDVIVAGSSLGGLTSAFVAFHHPDVIGKVLSQSGSYQFIPGAFDHDIAQTTEGNVLTREIAAAPKKPIKLYLEAGLFEAGLLDSNRHIRDVLVAKGYPVTYREFHGGHDYWLWRGTISDGLIALLPTR